MQIFKKMNRWIKWIMKTAKIYNENPDLVDRVVKSKKPTETLDAYFSRNEREKIEKLKKELRRKDLNRKLIEEYPSKNVFYKGRTLRGDNTRINVPVQVLVTPEDPRIKEDLEKWGFLDSNEDWETLIPKVYKKIYKEYYSYAYDKNVWEVSEFWEFPFEMYEKGFKGFDCDSWSHFIVSYFRKLGLPAGYVWIVVGNCEGGGHSTIYVYSEEDDKFHHLNSTYGRLLSKISIYPTHKDAKEGNDKMGIQKVWLSFNDLVSRSTFKNKEIGKIMIK